MEHSASLGELHVPGAAHLHGSRTFVLTVPSAAGGRVELLFGLLAADAPKKLVEKLADRMAEEMRPVFFSKRAAPPEAPDADEWRYEAALKVANRAILGFLYEHRLSLPGIRLRGAVAALIGDRLFVSNRGGVRGLLFIPSGASHSPFTLFEETPDRASDPKFFSSLQSGSLPPGARVVMATAELFELLDEAHVRNVYAQPDFQRAAREIKSSLKGGKDPVTIMTLTVPEPAKEEALGPIPARVSTDAPRERARPMRPAGPDIGEWIAGALAGAGRGALAAAKLVPRAAAGLGRGVRAIFRAPLALGALASSERRKALAASVTGMPDRVADALVARLNAVPERSRLHFLLVLTVATLFVHGLAYSAKRQLIVGEVRAYEATLTEIQTLQTDLDASLAYGNEARTRELLTRLQALADALPSETDNQREARAQLEDAIAARKERLQKLYRLGAVPAYAAIGDAAGEFRAAALVRRGGKLYAFSSSAPAVRVIADDGAVLEAPYEGSPVMAATDARTGILLLTAAGEIRLWNPDDGSTVAYGGATYPATTPILYFQGRIYAPTEGRIERRPIGTTSLGAPADAASGYGADLQVSGLAADGALYALSPDGAVRKFLRGALVADFASPVPEPAATGAFGLWTSADSDRLVYAERGGRLFLLDKKTGALRAQLQADGLAGLSGMAVSEDGKSAYVLTGGDVRRIPLEIPGFK